MLFEGHPPRPPPHKDNALYSFPYKLKILDRSMTVPQKIEGSYWGTIALALF